MKWKEKKLDEINRKVMREEVRWNRGKKNRQDEKRRNIEKRNSNVHTCSVYLSLNCYNVFFYYFDLFIVIMFLHIYSKLCQYCIF